MHGPRTRLGVQAGIDFWMIVAIERSQYAMHKSTRQASWSVFISATIRRAAMSRFPLKETKDYPTPSRHCYASENSPILPGNRLQISCHLTRSGQLSKARKIHRRFAS